MAEIHVDTKKMREEGMQMIKLSNELNSQLDGLFKRLESVPSVTHEWVGDSSEYFVNLVKFDKIQYYKLKDDLLLRGKKLVESADLLEFNIKRIRGKLS